MAMEQFGIERVTDTGAIAKGLRNRIFRAAFPKEVPPKIAHIFDLERSLLLP